jgi:hypothetical protein
LLDTLDIFDEGQTIDKNKINGWSRRLLGTTLLKGDERRHVLLKGEDMEETCLGSVL